MPFWKLHYHLVWATHGREPIIDEEAEQLIKRSIWSTARSTKIHIHAIGMVADHVHVAAAILTQHRSIRSVATVQGRNLTRNQQWAPISHGVSMASVNTVH